MMIKFLFWSILFIGVVFYGFYKYNQIELYREHREQHKDVDRTVSMTFENFEKFFAVNGSRWRWSPCDYCQSHSNELNNYSHHPDKDEVRLYFRDDREIPRWSVSSYAYTQVFFDFKNFIKYLKWLNQRKKAVEKNELFQKNKADLDNMKELLAVVQSDIDKQKAEAEEQIRKESENLKKHYQQLRSELNGTDIIMDLFNAVKENENAGT